MLDRTPRSLKRRGNPRKGMQHSRKPSRRDHLFRSSLRRCGGRFFSPSLGGVSSSQVTPIMSFFALVDPFVLPSPLVLFFFFFLLFFLDFVVYFLRKSIWFHEICGYGSDDRMNRSLSPWTHSGSSLSVFISESWESLRLGRGRWAPDVSSAVLDLGLLTLWSHILQMVLVVIFTDQSKTDICGVLVDTWW